MQEMIHYAQQYKLNNFDNITNEHRLKQYIAGRLALANILNLNSIPELTKTHTGKPIFKNLNLHFSISHCDDRLVVGVSKRNIGIDIQSVNEKLIKVKNKFLCQNELNNILPIKTININYLLYLKQLCLCWSSKEALYKLLERESISLKNNLKITHIDNKNKRVQVNFIENNKYQTFSIYFLLIDNYYISYVLSDINT